MKQKLHTLFYCHKKPNWLKFTKIKLLTLLFFITGSLIVNAQRTAVIRTVGVSSFCKSGTAVTANIRVDITGGSGSYTVVYRAASVTGASAEFTLPNYVNGASIPVGQSSSTTYTLVSVTENRSGLTATISGSAVITIFEPILGAITHATCQNVAGSVVISSLPLTPWTIKSSNNQVLANRVGVTTFTLPLPAGTNNFTITNSSGCVVPYSVTINPQPTVINAPVLNAAQLPCKQNSFVQDWNAVTEATGYRIDVATDSDFTNFVAGYENKLLGKVTEETITGINPTATYYVRLRAVTDCLSSESSNISTVFTHTTTYNGTWSDGLPDSNKNVIFDNVTYTLPANTNACTCQVNPNTVITVPGNITLKIENDLSVLGNGKLTFENNASLVQINNVPNTGNITYKRLSTPMAAGDYTYWSSPVAGQGVGGISPKAFTDNIYFFDSNGSNYWVDYWGIMAPGKGYITQLQPSATLPQGGAVTFPYAAPATFTGVPNNGDIQGENTIAKRFYLVGNPYPSGLDADQFMYDNIDVLSGTLYLWTHNTPVDLSGGYQYSSDDYASYNGVGGVATRPAISGGNEPTGKIAAGQSFMIEALTAGTIKFNNSMRVVGDNSQFFKQIKNNKSVIEKHRFWLNLTNKTGAFKQILIGYVSGATNGYDDRFDGQVFNGNSFINFYSRTQTTNLVIQGRALPLEDTDSIQLGYSSTIQGVFSIEIQKMDGQFLNKAIYLEDKKTNTFFNLKNGGYEFSTLKGTFDDRFIIHYTPNSIETPVLNEIASLSCNQSSFVLNWKAIPNASSYRLDIATDEEFTNFVPEFQDKEVGDYTTHEVTGLTGTRYYARIRAMYNSTVSPNSNVITIAAPVTVYNGEWSNGLPDSTKNVVFDNVNYTLPTDLSACSCQVNATAKIIVPNGVTVKLQNGLYVQEKGSLTFENNASLVQVNDEVNSGTIVYKRVSAPMKTLDYTYWSSPVAEQKLNVLSPNTASNRYLSLSNDNWVSEKASASMTAAKGYIIGAPKSGTWPNGEKVSFPYSQPVQFTGVPNNGHFEFTVERTGRKNLIGNPYPSALDADAFLEANNGVLGGTLYFWTNNTSPQFLKYVLDDYASYNALGGVAAAAAGESAGGTNSLKPVGKIAAGQSFMTESLTSGTVVFDNYMRTEGQNSQFLKHGKTASLEKHRFWLNLTSLQGAFEQILIGYTDGATNGYDNRFDGRDWSGNSYTSFYSVNQEDKLTIQGRALPFDNTDVVPLGYRSLLGGYFTISLDSTDGLFSSQSIYLEDKNLKVYHNLKNGPYSFLTFLGTYDNRFVIHYNTVSGKTNKSVDVNTSSSFPAENQIIVSTENNQINIHSFEEIIDKVFVYDLNGRKIYEKEQVNSADFSTTKLMFKKQLLVVTIILQNGKTVTKKIVF